VEATVERITVAKSTANLLPRRLLRSKVAVITQTSLSPTSTVTLLSLEQVPPIAALEIVQIAVETEAAAAVQAEAEGVVVEVADQEVEAAVATAATAARVTKPTGRQG
jgi:hypothetical protein